MTRPGAPPRRVLIFAEAVTLAHVARPLCFARGLDPHGYRVTVTSSGRTAAHITAAGYEHAVLESIEPQEFLDALAKGRPLFDAATLVRYVENDLALIDRYRPDLVVGDFRLSLSVSARLARLPYLTIGSAYWSPFYAPPQWPVPALPLTRLLPLGLAHALFSAARPIAFAAHCRPLNHVRRRFGLPPLPADLRRVYTDADWVAYSDLPELFPTSGMPSTHRFLGAALWEPLLPLPPWWDAVPADRPLLYVTLGSSGDAALLPQVVATLADLPASLLVATAGAALPQLPANAFAAAYLPGMRAAAQSRVVICNGGSLTAYQALAAGAFVIGIAGNLDQFLNMQGFERMGVGRTLRADRFSAAALRRTVETLLDGDGNSGAAEAMRRACASRRMDTTAGTMVAEILA